jgi:hypothetical protein
VTLRDFGLTNSRVSADVVIHPMYAYTGAAEITPTFQRGITNKWYEVSPKTFYFPNVDITKFFSL